MSQYIADNGTVITDDMVDRWAKDAEEGFPDSIVEPFEGRAWETRTEPLKPRTIRVSDTLWNLVEANAKARDMSVSEYTRQVLVQSISPQTPR